MRSRLTLKVAVLAAVVLGFGTLGCSSDGGGGSADPGTTGGTTGEAPPNNTTTGELPPDNTTTGETPPDNTTTGEPLDPATCGLKPMGFVASSGGDIVYQNNTVDAVAQHLGEQGCVTSASLSFAIDGGCNLDLVFENDSGYWVLASGTFKGEAKCGDFWTGEAVEYTLDTAASVGGLVGLAPVADAAAAESCAEAKGVQVVGKALFVAPPLVVGESDLVFNMNLNGLNLDGQLRTALAADAASVECPKEPRLCQGVECGEDFFGADCGGCEAEGFSCSGGTCQQGGCIEAGDGNTVGFHIGDETWKEEDGTTFRMHEFCGAPAIWLIKSATWCGACHALRGMFQQLYDTYAPKGVIFGIIPGQDQNGQPITAATAKQYLQIHDGYQDGWHILVDPNWQKIEALIPGTSNGIPAHIILDQDLVLRHNSVDTDFIHVPQTKLIQILAAQGL